MNKVFIVLTVKLIGCVLVDWSTKSRVWKGCPLESVIAEYPDAGNLEEKKNIEAWLCIYGSAQ